MAGDVLNYLPGFACEAEVLRIAPLLSVFSPIHLSIRLPFRPADGLQTITV
ncbi:hypothetical protein [Herminiimonas sp. CN]|uniref:hypothetical protein n=1 Tax=Herminiimonas sp. CN TaxID=1349818 RepID=UPI0012DF813B|nr:hypothetical protein [Herminiimonas sp. CN]